QVLAPVVDVARDPRWGRFEETYGEDPFLTSQLGLAATLGFQGDTKNGIDKNHVAATLKHITGHGQPEGGNNIAPANAGERQVREVFLPPFELAIRKGNAASVMASYNEIDGVPSHANRFLLKTILRDEWDFKGPIVSDYGGITDLHTRHRIVDSEEAAGLEAFKAGVAIETPDFKVFPALKKYLETDKLSIETLNDAVRKILVLKFKLGLFDNPYVDVDFADQVSKYPSSIALAKEAADKAIVLLQNKNNVLPLDIKKIKRIAVIGPNADREQLGGYSDVPKYVHTLREGIEKFAKGKAQVTYSEGCRIVEEKDPLRWYRDKNTVTKPETNTKRIQEAVNVARQSDVIILALGSDEAIFREAWADDHLGDATSLELKGSQNELLNALKNTGKPIVVTLFNGGPLLLQNVQAKASAILECWYLGQEGGNAVADVLFGNNNPSGKLPCSFPASEGQIPVFYNHKPSARRGYQNEPAKPLFPFGFGLSYTQFEFAVPRIDNAVISRTESTKVSVKVTNTGSKVGTETVQMYISDKVSCVTRPVKELKGFQKVTLQPGESKEVSFVISPELLMFYDHTMKRIIEPGEFDVLVGNSSDNADLKKVTLIVK
ncbi:MAG: glycoside hydrolase family 3 C-terminal domain-containing protein, partial [Leadbetterella sp.]